MKRMIIKAISFVMSLAMVGGVGLGISKSLVNKEVNEVNADATYTGDFSHTFTSDKCGASQSSTAVAATISGMSWSVTLPYFSASDAGGWKLASNTNTPSARFESSDYWDRVNTIVVRYGTNQSMTFKCAVTVGSTTITKTASAGQSNASLTYDFSSTKPYGTITIVTSNVTGGYDFKGLSITSGSNFTISGDSEVYTTETVQMSSSVSDVTWSVSDDTLATIDSSGLLTATNPGTVTVYANGTRYNQQSHSILIKDITIPRINMSATTTNVWVGYDPIQVVATPTNFVPDSLEYISSNTSVATVDENGYVTAVARGSVQISAQATYGGDVIVSDDYVTINAKKADISLSASAVTVGFNSSSTVTVTTTDFVGSATVSAVSSKLTVVSTSVNGKTITLKGGKVAGSTATVSVTATDTQGHVSSTKNISVTIGQDYNFNLLTARPSTTTRVYLISNYSGTRYYVTSTITGALTTSFASAQTFMMDSSGRIYKEGTSSYIQEASSTTSVNIVNSSKATTWVVNSSTGALTSSSGRYLARNSSSGNANKLGTYSGSGDTTYGVCAYSIPVKTESVTLSKNSTSIVRTDSDSVNLTINNFIDTGVNVSYSTANICEATLTPTTTGYRINVEGLAAGSTNVTFTVSGGSSSHSATLAVTVLELETFVKDKNGVQTDIPILTALRNCVNNAESHISCDASGTSSTISWSNVESSFSVLDEEMMDNLKYGVSNENGNVVEAFLAKYDYIIGKYKTDTYNDFLGRIDSGKILLVTPIIVSSINQSELPIVIIITVSSISLIGLYLFKKKTAKKI